MRIDMEDRNGLLRGGCRSREVKVGRLTRRAPIESVAEAQRLAKRRLPRPVYNALIAGVEKGVTLDLNVAAFDQIGLTPRIAADIPDERQLATKVLGLDLSMPVVISPAGAQAIDPEGELPVARASRAAGIAMGLSSFASTPFESVVKENPNSLFQLYWIGSRDDVAECAERARAAGAKGLIVTVDYAFTSRRDWGSPKIPERVSLATISRFAPMAVGHPNWAIRFLVDGIPELKVPNLATRRRGVPTFKQAGAEWRKTALPTWADLRWLREQWDGPFLVKGVFHPDDARNAVDIGATAVSVSNHGGNNLDTTPASLRALPAVVDAVGNQIEVLFDGGIRRGSDVLKALAMGARAVLIGRAWLWGLAAAGEDGVREVLEILRAGIDESLIGTGHGSIKELSRSDLLIPDGFEVR